VQIGNLTGKDAVRAAEVLAAAFASYPFLVRAFSGAKKPRMELLREMFRIAVDYRLAVGLPTLVAREGETLLGAATLSLPELPEFPEEFAARWDALDRELAPEGRAVFAAYEELQSRAKPAEPHVYLVAVGVSPLAQGRGIGRALVDAARELAAATPGARGLALDTHDPANVPKYKRMGMRLLGKHDLMGMPNWYFWDG
jgi:GNAT superfamily N-acetyltransferase